MDVDRFWEVNHGLAPENAEEQLRDRLSALEPGEIESYQEHFDHMFDSAYRWSLWAAAYIIKGGCSDDGFTDFWHGLVARGRTIFETAIEDPDSLVVVVHGTDTDCISNESFGYVADGVYESKTNEDMPFNDAPRPSDPSGEDWDFDDEQLCEQKLPKLWRKLGE